MAAGDPDEVHTIMRPGDQDVDLPPRGGFFAEIDSLSELVCAMADLLTDLLDEGPRAAWTAREEATWNAAEDIRQRASRERFRRDGRRVRGPPSRTGPRGMEGPPRPTEGRDARMVVRR